MSQINVSPGSGGARDSSAGSIAALVVVLAVVAFLVFAFAFGGFQRFAGGPAVVPVTSGAPAGPNTTINVEPRVNVQAPAANPPAQAPAPAANAPANSGAPAAKP